MIFVMRLVYATVKTNTQNGAMNYTYGKKDKLKSKKTIELLFSDGKAITVFPLRLIYLPIAHEDGVTLKASVSVSKRLHKKAVTRNRIKRLLREAYRLNIPKYFNTNETPYAFMFLYIGKEVPEYNDLFKTMTALLERFVKKSGQ